jgi:hypothetical protein
MAAVHCVIIGICASGIAKNKTLWTYENSNPVKKSVDNINAYLLDAPPILVHAQKKPLASYLPPLLTGNEPRDGGFLSNIDALTAEEIRRTDPIATRYLRLLIGSEEVLNGAGKRFCLWLKDANPTDIKNSEVLTSRVASVKANRLKAVGTKSAKARTADTPTLFSRIAQPETRYIAVPSVSSEKRKYIPVAFFEADIIVNNAVFYIESEELWLFAIIESSVFTTWVRAVSSRMKSDYQIAASTVYNTFPAPTLSEHQKTELSLKAQAVLDERSKYPESTLGDLYDPLLTPVNLARAHKDMDGSVLKVFGLKADATEDKILTELLTRYQNMSKAH